VLIAISLSLATLARLPLPMRPNRYSRVSLRKSLDRTIFIRFILVALSGLTFAAGLALAGWAQLA